MRISDHVQRIFTENVYVKTLELNKVAQTLTNPIGNFGGRKFNK